MVPGNVKRHLLVLKRASFFSLNLDLVSKRVL